MRKRGVGRPRDGNPAETRREILKAAEERFAAAGFSGATTRQVANRAGVNVATLHYHFGSKEGLYRAVLAEAIRGSLPSPNGGGPLAEKLAAAVEALHDAGFSRPSLARLSLMDLLAGPPGSGTPGDEEDPRVALLRGLLASAAASPAAGVVSPAAAARWIVTLVDASLLSAREDSALPPEARERLRKGVVAAALRVAGLS